MMIQTGFQLWVMLEWQTQLLRYHKNLDCYWFYWQLRHGLNYAFFQEILIAEVVSPAVPGDMPEGLRNYSVRSTVLTRNIGTINEDE